MSDKSRHSTGSIGTVCNISSYAEEIEELIGGTAAPILATRDESIEDPIAFAMETHLEEFLIENWGRTDLGSRFDIYEEEGELGREVIHLEPGRDGRVHRVATGLQHLNTGPRSQHVLRRHHASAGKRLLLDQPGLGRARLYHRTPPFSDSDRVSQAVG